MSGSFVRLIRPRQFVKNGLVFLPMFFAQRLFEGNLLLVTLIVGMGFSLISGGIYILNDYLDLEMDQNHPVKKNRPLAAGTISKHHALLYMIVLWATGLGVLAWVAATCFYLGAAYIALNLAYNFKLKHIPILDVCTIALGFVLRIYLGAAVGDIPVTMWIVLMTYLLALFIGFAKRRDDVLLAEQGLITRKAIQGYNLTFVNTAMSTMASVLLVAYISYTTSPEVQLRMQNTNLYLTVFFVLLGIFRYLQITLVELKSGDPTHIFLKDPFLLLTILGWLLTFMVLIYYV